MLTAWTSLDWFFGLPTSVVTSGGTITASTPLNLDTFKNCNGTYVDPNGLNGGIEWSGYQRGNRIVAIVSNFGNGNQATYWTLNTINANLPSLSPVVPMGCHAESSNTCPTPPSTTSSLPTPARCAVPMPPIFSRHRAWLPARATHPAALGLTSFAPARSTSSMWYQAGNPGRTC